MVAGYGNTTADALLPTVQSVNLSTGLSLAAGAVFVVLTLMVFLACPKTPPARKDMLQVPRLVALPRSSPSADP